MNQKLAKVLIVDDEPDIVELLAITLARMNIETMKASSMVEAKAILEQNNFNLALLDLRLPDGSGLDLIDYMQQNRPHMPVTMITAYGTMEIAIEALKKGAFDFIVKPIDLTAFRNMVKSALQASMLNDTVQSSLEDLLGETPEIIELRKTITKLARTQAPIHICGPSGSGKELVARLIHEMGPRGKKPFIAVNCGAIPQELMESEFFGHKKGSFTGATYDKAGLFQAADGGTLFLDEIGELPISMQVKLLRAIQEKSVRAVGDVKEQNIDVRILSATNQNLLDLIKSGTFREDLFYRINVIEIFVPALKEHAADIPLLVQHFMHQLAELNKTSMPTITPEAMRMLCCYAYPGNVRELKNILERAFALCENNIIETQDLHLPNSINKIQSLDTKFRWGVDNIDDYAEHLQKELIIIALRDSNKDKEQAAKLLGITPRILRYKLKKLGIE